MKISEKQINPFSKIIHLSGRLDAHLVDQLEPALVAELDDENLRNLAFDIESVTYLGSSGIKLFLYMNQKMKLREGKFVLLNINSANLRLLKSMEISDFFQYADSENEVAELFKDV